MHIDALSVLYAQLTRDLLAIAKFLLYLHLVCDLPGQGPGAIVNKHENIGNSFPKILL